MIKPLGNPCKSPSSRNRQIVGAVVARGQCAWGEALWAALGPPTAARRAWIIFEAEIMNDAEVNQLALIAHPFGLGPHCGQRQRGSTHHYRSGRDETGARSRPGRAVPRLRSRPVLERKPLGSLCSLGLAGVQDHPADDGVHQAGGGGKGFRDWGAGGGGGENSAAALCSTLGARGQPAQTAEQLPRRACQAPARWQAWPRFRANAQRPNASKPCRPIPREPCPTPPPCPCLCSSKSPRRSWWSRRSSASRRSLSAGRGR